MTLPRRVIPGATYLVTRRCFERRFLLVPRGQVPEVFGYCLAVAAERHGIQVHAAAALSNHWHGVVTDPSGHISAFIRDFHALTARALNAHHGRWDAVWSGQRPSLVRLVGPEDVMDKLVYTLTNVVAAGLVRRHDDWPGLHTAPGSTLRAPARFERPRRFFRHDGQLPAAVDLPVTIPPAFAGDPPEAFVERLRRQVRAREHELQEKARREGRSFLGRREVLRQRRDKRPSTFDRRRGRHPTLACATKERRLAELDALATFRTEYRAAREAWRSGDHGTTFPYGTLQLVEQHGARSRPPPAALRAAA
ncbi:MAG: transposase [Myxococcota bacterium]